MGLCLYVIFLTMEQLYLIDLMNNLIIMNVIFKVSD